MHRALMLLACGLAVAGCDAVVAADTSSPACSDAPASPLDTEVVLEALRDAGLTMGREVESELCAIEDVVAELTNGEENMGREGLVSCGVRREALRSSTLQVDLDAMAASPVFSGDKAELWLANVECTIYPEGDDKEGQIARLQRALEKLEATL